MNAVTNDQPDRTAVYVVTDLGQILVQASDPASPGGFYLTDDDQTWPGGFGAATSWTVISDDDPRITPEIRERLGWLLAGES